jgi:hypothetical protein
VWDALNWLMNFFLKIQFLCVRDSFKIVTHIICFMKCCSFKLLCTKSYHKRDGHYNIRIKNDYSEKYMYYISCLIKHISFSLKRSPDITLCLNNDDELLHE